MNPWFYEKNGARQGGVDETQIAALIRAGKLGYGSTVWQQGLDGWTRLEDTPLRQYLTDTPPPLAGHLVNNTLVWVLAFAPLIGLFLESLLALAVNGGNEYRAERDMIDGSYWYVTVMLNILLSILDEKRLKKAGHDTGRFRGWVWLVPVYLYQRAKNLRQNLAYFIVWITCFALILLSSLSS